MVIKSKFPGKCSACGCGVSVGQEIEWQRGVREIRHAHVTDCADAKMKRAANAPATPKLDLTAIVAFIKSATERGLKNPKLRVLAPSGTTEMRLSITKTGIHPGSIAVLVGGEFHGCIRPDGSTVGKVASSTPIQERLLAVARNPIAAAKEFAAIMGYCCFCGKQLTDSGSVQCGYGPICAKHWGLPHVALGTPSVGVRVQQPLSRCCTHSSCTVHTTNASGRCDGHPVQLSLEAHS